MLDNTDPLADWDLPDELRFGFVRGLRHSKPAQDYLRKVQRRVQDGRRTGKPSFDSLYCQVLESTAVRLADEDLAQVTELCTSVAQLGGTSAAYVESALLHALGSSALPAALDFYVAHLDQKRPRERFAKDRRRLCLAGIARIAQHHPESSALELLRGALRHKDATTKAFAAECLARIGASGGDSLDDEDVQRLRTTATKDRKLLARYAARKALADLGLPVPNDAPAGSYVFKVWLHGNEEVWRLVEVGGTQRLDHLHEAIQDAFEWDADHLYLFQLDGKRRNDANLLAGPGLSYDPPARSTSDFQLGQLGLRRRNRFTYLFDMGDHHLFEIQVDEVRESAEGELPREIGGEGEGPEQYLDWW